MQLDEAHKQNMEITQAMTELGINPRPTVTEWLNKKKEQRRAELEESLKQWERYRGLYTSIQSIIFIFHVLEISSKEI